MHWLLNFRGHADGHGDRFLQSERRHGGLAGDTCPSIASDNAYYLSVHLHDVLWHGRCGCRACQQLQGAGWAECAARRMPAFTSSCMEVVLLGIVFALRGQVGGWFTDNAEVSGMVAAFFFPFFDLPVRRWVAD